MCAAPTAARCRSASLVKVTQTTGPEFIYRFNEFNAAQLNITGAPGYSSGQVRKALEEVFHQTMPSDAGFDYSGMSFRSSRRRRACPRGLSSASRCSSSS